MTPTARSLKWFRDAGWMAGEVERFNAIIKIKHDLWGIGDVVAVKPGEPPCLVQVTTFTNTSARLAKIKASDALPVLVACGWSVVVHGWRPPRKQTELKRKLRPEERRWRLQVIDATE